MAKEKEHWESDLQWLVVGLAAFQAIAVFYQYLKDSTGETDAAKLFFMASVYAAVTVFAFLIAIKMRPMARKKEKR